MKTAQIMKRELFGNEIRQNHLTQMLNANDLHRVGNDLRKKEGLSEKKMVSYFELDSTKEFLQKLCLVENCSLDDVKKATSGRYGGTWVAPAVFVDMAMWYSPELKVRILKWVLDGLLQARDDSGESFKEMNSVLNRHFPKEFSNPISYIEAAKTIAAACRVGTGKDKWNKATEDQLKLRDKIQENVCLLADMSPNAGTCISKAIQKAKHSMRPKIESK